MCDLETDPSGFDLQRALASRFVLAEAGLVLPRNLKTEPIQWLAYLVESIGLDLAAKQKTVGYSLNGGPVEARRPKVRKQKDGTWRLPDGSTASTKPAIRRLRQRTYVVTAESITAAATDMAPYFRRMIDGSRNQSVDFDELADRLL